MTSLGPSSSFRVIGESLFSKYKESVSKISVVVGVGVGVSLKVIVGVGVGVVVLDGLGVIVGVGVGLSVDVIVGVGVSVGLENISSDGNSNSFFFRLNFD